MRELVSALLGRYVDPYSEEGLQALRELLADHRDLRDSRQAV